MIANAVRGLGPAAEQTDLCQRVHGTASDSELGMASKPRMAVGKERLRKRGGSSGGERVARRVRGAALIGTMPGAGLGAGLGAGPGAGHGALGGGARRGGTPLRIAANSPQQPGPFKDSGPRHARCQSSRLVAACGARWPRRPSAQATDRLAARTSKAWKHSMQTRQATLVHSVACLLGAALLHPHGPMALVPRIPCRAPRA